MQKPKLHQDLATLGQELLNCSKKEMKYGMTFVGAMYGKQQCISLNDLHLKYPAEK